MMDDETSTFERDSSGSGGSSRRALLEAAAGGRSDAGRQSSKSWRATHEKKVAQKASRELKKEQKEKKYQLKREERDQQRHRLQEGYEDESESEDESIESHYSDGGYHYQSDSESIDFIKTERRKVKKKDRDAEGQRVLRETKENNRLNDEKRSTFEEFVKKAQLVGKVIAMKATSSYLLLLTHSKASKWF